MPSPTEARLDIPLRELAGVGLERTALLARLGLLTVEDLLLHRPLRYEDRRAAGAIRELQLGKPALTRGTIVALGVKRYRKGTRSLFEFVMEDGTGRLHCRWWNQPYQERNFQAGDEVLVFGRVKDLKPRTIDHPETEVIEGGAERSIHVERIVPIYPLTEGLPQRWLRGLIFRTLAKHGAAIREPWPGLELAGWPARAEAVRDLHFPAEPGLAQRARERLALDEFIALQLAMQRRRRALETKVKAWPCGGDNRWIKPFLGSLGFSLTAAQTRVLRELRQDLHGPHPMRRLVQGDVGSGKTVVAACAALMTLESGFNVALMAPTEILAQQHDQTFNRWLKPLGLAVRLRTGSHRPDGDAGASAGQLELAPAASSASEPTAPGLWIGTHALLESDVILPDLGLVIIDEQHKFGVAQREQLVRKGHYPHLLVMTATPIPRTLGLTLYGDLDISTIDELPAGRGRVRTFVRAAEQLPKVHAFVKEKVSQGRQVYIVFPRIEEEDASSGLKAVTREWESLQKTFAPHRVGMLHGRLRAEDKEHVVRGFRRGEVHILLATSVIEVGLDVPNATVMVIENADQFGLAQLHQLRGRIGRGAHESYCILLAEAKTGEARRRLQVLESSQDGFAIAEADLQLRGPGEFLGQNQSGLPPFRFADLTADAALIAQARALAAQLIDRPDPDRPSP